MTIYCVGALLPNSTAEFAPLEDGIPRVIGSSGERMASIYLTAPPEDLSRAYMTIELPNDREDLVTFNAVGLRGFVKHAVPTWKEEDSWLAENIKRVSGEE